MRNSGLSYLQQVLVCGLSVAVCRAQSIRVVPLPVFGGAHKRWYVWLIVAIAGVTLIYVLFFVIRGFLVARKRRSAFLAEGVNPEDPVYTEKHQAILAKILPRSKMPQGKGSTNFSPMLSNIDSWDTDHARKPSSVPQATDPKLPI